MSQLNKIPRHPPDTLMRSQLIEEAAEMAGRAHLDLIGAMFRLELAGIDPDALAETIEELDAVHEELRTLG